MQRKHAWILCFKDFSRMEVVIFRRCDSKFVLPDGILVASLDPTLINNC